MAVDLKVLDQKSEDFEKTRFRFLSKAKFQFKVEDPHNHSLKVYFKTRNDGWNKEHALELDLENGQWVSNHLIGDNNELVY